MIEEKQIRIIFKAYLNNFKQLETATIFFLSNLYLKQGVGFVYIMVDFIYMSLFDLQRARSENNNIKILAQSRTRTLDPWIAKPLPFPWGHQICYTIDKLKLNKVLLVLFIATS